MSKMYRNVMVVLCFSAFVSLFAGVAVAETVYLYDFDNLSTGTLAGQDSWANVTGSGITVTAASGAWMENYLDTTTGSSTQDKRVNDGTWSFSFVNNDDFDVSVKALAIGDGYSTDLALGGLQQRLVGSQDPFHWLLAGTQGGDLYWRICLGRSDYDAHTNVEILTPHGVASGEEKVFIVGISATALGSGQYSMQPYYQNITDGGAKTNYGSAFTIAFGDLGLEWDSLQARLTGRGQVGDIRISSGQVVPEPSAIVLLTCGLVGLLAYAWRKRK